MQDLGLRGRRQLHQVRARFFDLVKNLVQAQAVFQTSFTNINIVKFNPFFELCSWSSPLDKCYSVVCTQGRSMALTVALYRGTSLIINSRPPLEPP